VLAPGIGPADVTEGERLVREALDELERFLPVWMLDGDDDLVRVRADVQRDLEAVAAAKLQPVEQLRAGCWTQALSRSVRSALRGVPGAPPVYGEPHQASTD
jgi:hypothetical protein